MTVIFYACILLHQTKFYAEELSLWKPSNISFAISPQTHEFVKYAKTRKVIHSFPTAQPNLTVEPLSNDPKHKDSLTFRIMDSVTQKEFTRFRAADIVQMHEFIASACG